MHQVWRAQAVVAVALIAVAAVFSPASMAAVFSASVAVILSEVMFAVICWRILRSKDDGRVGRAIRARYLKVATMVVFLAASLGAVGQSLPEVAAWSGTVIILLLLPALVVRAELARNKDRLED